MKSGFPAFPVVIHLVNPETVRSSLTFLLKFLLLILLLGVRPLPAQPDTLTYRHDSVAVYDYAHNPRGFHLFEPAAPRPDSAPVVVFLHGYGGLNPMIYGGWIRHLVRQGYVVVYPRYQRNLVFPRPPKFARNVVRGLRTALDTLRTGPSHVRPLSDPLVYAGHSYGGVLAAHLAGRAAEYGLALPKALLLAAPGSGPFRGGLLEDYATLPEQTQLFLVTHQRDRIVGDVLARRILRQATRTANRYWLHQDTVICAGDTLSAHHNECYAVDSTLDNGLRNYTAEKALRVGSTNSIDRGLYWPLLDHLLASTYATAEQPPWQLGEDGAMRVKLSDDCPDTLLELWRDEAKAGEVNYGRWKKKWQE